MGKKGAKAGTGQQKARRHTKGHGAANARSPPMDSPIKIPVVVVTDDDIRKYPHHTRESIHGIKLIEAIDSPTLKRAIADDSVRDQINGAIGKDTNPNWTIGQCAETLYDRGEIDEDELQRICDY